MEEKQEDSVAFQVDAGRGQGKGSCITTGALAGTELGHYSRMSGNRKGTVTQNV